MLRFLADEYDDTCDTVFPMLQGILASVSAHILGIVSDIHGSLQHKRSRKVATSPLDDSVRTFLASLLRVLLEKLKWDEEADVEDSDEEDNAEFERLRKVGDVSYDLSFHEPPAY